MTHDKNCLLVWSDTGTPDGHLMLTYFHVAGDRVIFHKSVEVLGHDTSRGFVAARSVSDVSAAYFDDRFWVGYKTIGSASMGDHPAFLSTFPRDLGRWGDKRAVLTRHVSAEAPVWLYDPRNPRREAAFAFTQWH